MKIKMCSDCDYEVVSVKIIVHDTLILEGYKFCFYKYRRHEEGVDWFMLIEYNTGVPIGYDSSHSGIMALLCLWFINKEKLLGFLNSHEKINKQ